LEVGEDGANPGTIEHLTQFKSIYQLFMLETADASEMLEALEVAFKIEERPFRFCSRPSNLKLLKLKGIWEMFKRVDIY